MKENRTSRYIDVLEQIVQNYNDSYHNSIGMAPSKVNNENLAEVAYNLYYTESDKRNTLPREARYKLGQHVLVSRLKSKFKKGYTSNFGDEIFKISDIHNTNPIQYSLSDLCEKESPILGKFYESEIAPIDLPPILDIEEITGVVKKRGRDFFQVKFFNKPQCEPEVVTLEYLKKGAPDNLLKTYGIEK